MHEITFEEDRKYVMSEIIRKITDDLFASKITREELAKYIGIAKSTLSDILNGHTEISFIYLVKIMMRLYEQQAPEIKNDMIIEYLTYAKPENKREALEYAAFRREFDSLKELIDEELKSSTDVNREWAEIYQIIYEHYRDKQDSEPKYDPYAFYDELDKKKKDVSSNEMKILIEILLCQTLYQMKEYKLLFKRIVRVEKKAQKISNKYIRSSYLVRIKEGMCVT
ncbi:AimR family lysis-lysogeny pheromone receptor, partial [Bacillus toyonensis]